MTRRFVLLDRDGTVIVERHYLCDPDQVALLPNAIQGLRQMQQMGLGLAIVTNQSGIGRGFFDRQRLTQIHDRLQQLLQVEGIQLDGIYYCPHVPDDRCSCRKPQPGLIHQAVQEFGLCPADSFVIGDKTCDIELGQRVGATTLLVKTGYGAALAAAGSVTPNYVVADLAAAAQVIQQGLAGEVRSGHATQAAIDH